MSINFTYLYTVILSRFEYKVANILFISLQVKVGAMSRALQLAGSVSRSPMSRQMDAAFSWDADRDANKQVAVKTSWTSGEKNTAIATLSLPAINQEVSVKSVVAVNQGQTLLDATTALSYSQDQRKQLTLSSKLEVSKQLTHLKLW